jgi:hypothetical protein
MKVLINPLYVLMKGKRLRPGGHVIPGVSEGSHIAQQRYMIE